VVGAIVVAFIGLLCALSTVPPAHAADDETCTQTLESACIQGTLLVRQGKQKNVPISGATVVLTSPSGDEQTTESDSDGKWHFNVTEEGTYQVSLDESTLPSGMEVEGKNQVNVPIKFGTIAANSASFSINASGYNPNKKDKAAEVMQGIYNGIVFGLLLALASIGVSLIYGTTGMSNFAHGEQVTLGGVLGYWFCNAGLPGIGTIGLLPAGILIVVVCGAIGWLQDRAIWQPLRRRGLGLTQLMIVSIGLSLALLFFYQLLLSTDTKQVSKKTVTPHYVFGDKVSWTSQSLTAALISIAIIAAIGYALMRTRIGRATRAVSDNPALAMASGIDTDRVIRIVWTVALALAGLSGLLYALVIQNGITALTGSQILLLLFAAVTLGGLGTAFGALVGSMVIGMIAMVAPTLGVPDDLKYATAMVLMILMLLFRPQGLLGKAQRVG
jgi:branched-chain amino acid transport system permease protein